MKVAASYRYTNLRHGITFFNLRPILQSGRGVNLILITILRFRPSSLKNLDEPDELLAKEDDEDYSDVMLSLRTMLSFQVLRAAV